MREVAAEFANPVMLYSVGKDSAVMLHLAMKAFYPSKPPFPLMHVDTTWKFKEMIEFRDQTAKRLGLDLIVHVNEDGVKRGINPFDSGSSLHTQVMKTEALKQALDKYGFDAAFGGARRDEEKSRAKERIFSFRDSIMAGTPRISGLNSGVSTTQVSIKAKASACFRSPTGPSWTSGNISWPKTSPSCRYILRKSARWWSVMAR